MNLKKEDEKKKYVSPQMTVMDMSMTSLLCQSGIESLFNGYAADENSEDDEYMN